MSIEDIKKELGKIKNKKSFLKEKLKEEQSTELKREIRQLLIKTLKEEAQVKLDTKLKVEYKITYDSMAESLEPIYFWTLDFMRNTYPSGLGLEVSKTEEEFEASASSGYFGEVGSRRTVMQDQAMKMLQTINTVIRSIINILYDLREFDIRIEHYSDLHSHSHEKKQAGKLALKGIWMDMVDIKKGAGSINALTRGDLQFVTLRDAFMYVENEADVDRLDLNDRVKNILKRKITEYLKWEKYSEEELTKRRNIEKSYLRSQVDSLKLYTKWARPYLVAAHRLKMKEFNSPDIIAAFNNMLMELSLFGKKETKPESVHPVFSKYNLDKKIYACLEVNFRFRSVPQSLRTQTASHYTHGGTTDLVFKPYVLDEEDLKELEQQELYEDMELVEDLTNVSLKELQEDLDKYLSEKKEEPKKGKNTMFSMGKSVGKGFSEVFGPLKEVKGFFNMKKGAPMFVIKETRNKAKEEALNIAFVAYDLYKKAHGMLSW